MIDSLGLIGSPTTSQVQSARVQVPSGAASFVDSLKRNIEHVDEIQQGAALAQDELMSGMRDDVEGVMIETQKADTAFRMLLALRNKLVEAYQELQQLRV